MKFLHLIFLIFATLLLLGCNSINAQDIPDYEDIEIKEELGRIIEIVREEKDQSLDVFGPGQKVQTVKVKILSGEMKGQEILIENRLTGTPAYDMDVKEGDEVVLNVETGPDGEPIINIENFHRFPTLIAIISIFVIFILGIGGIKGLKALISLGLTYFLIFSFLIPLILQGYPPLLLTIFISFLATGITIFVISGINLKSLSAIIGTVSGVTIAGLMALATIKLAPLSGMPTEEAIGLWTTSPDLNFRGILASAMIIGALGASMDVGISIASSIYEIKKANPLATKIYLIKAGMNVGKDIMGTMTNTLLLAYTGSAMFLILLAYNNVSFTKFINLDPIVSEITAALAGSTGLILCIPITAVVSSYLYTIKKTADNTNEEQ